MVPKSDVVSSNCEEGSERVDLGGPEVRRLTGEYESLGEGEKDDEGLSFIKKEFLYSFLFFGVDSALMPFFFSPTSNFPHGLDLPATSSWLWRFCFWVGLSFLVNMVSRSSSELLGCSFSLCFFRLRLAAAKMEETRGWRNSRLQWSFPDPQEPWTEKARVTDSVTGKRKQICKPRSHKALRPSKKTWNKKPNRCPCRWLSLSTPTASLIAAQIRGWRTEHRKKH